MAALSSVTAALERAWAAIRQQYPEVAPAAMVVYLHPAGDRKGHYQEKGWTTKEHGKLDEVHLSSHVLTEGPWSCIETLLHEAVHSIANAKGIQDTSRQGRYHNQAFVALAEAMGLVCLPIPPYGYAQTSLQPSTFELFRNTMQDLEQSIELWQYLPMKRDGGAKGKGSGRVKLTCPACERIIYASKKTIALGKIACVPCGRTFGEDDAPFQA